MGSKTSTYPLLKCAFLSLTLLFQVVILGILASSGCQAQQQQPAQRQYPSAAWADKFGGVAAAIASQAIGGGRGGEQARSIGGRRVAPPGFTSSVTGTQVC